MALWTQLAVSAYGADQAVPLIDNNNDDDPLTWDLGPTFGILAHLHVILRPWRIVNGVMWSTESPRPSK